MLNEAYELSLSMKEAGISPESWNKDYAALPKYKTFKCLLDINGSVTDLEPIKENETISRLRKWEVANGTSFPAFNIMPFLRAGSAEAREQLKALKKDIQSEKHLNVERISSGISSLWDFCEELWSKSEEERINRCLRDHPAKLQKILGDSHDKDLNVIAELIRRSAKLNANKLQKELRTVIEKHLLDSPGSAKDWIDIFLVSTSKTAKKLSLVLELSDWSTSYDYPANDIKIQRWVNSRLMSSSVQNDAGTIPSFLDAFGYPLQEGDSKKKFPDVNLPKLGSVKLRAMSSEIPCQKRYGKLDSYSFPASESIRQSMKDSVEWLRDPERKGKTWEDITGACGFTKRDGKKVPIAGIIFAYPTLLPADPPELAQLFGGKDDNSDSKAAKFEQYAANVTSALNLVIRKNHEANIRIFALAKADKARTKLLLNRYYNATQLIDAAQEWIMGCRNIPKIMLNIGTEKNPDWVIPSIPFPTEVVECLSVVWLRSGTHTDIVHGLNMREGIALLMERGIAESGLGKRVLHLVVAHGCQLLLALGHADHRHDGIFKLVAYAKHARILPSLLGLFLYQLDIMKGDYMRTSPFLIGQLLGLADTLHKEYCIHVRKGQIPPQLIGNAAMAVALNNPAAALARLSERVIPYQAWANSSSGDGVGLAKWTLQQFGRIAEELGEQTIPENCGDVEKAQIFLGYLARPESSRNDHQSNSQK